MKKIIFLISFFLLASCSSGLSDLEKQNEEKTTNEIVKNNLSETEEIKTSSNDIEKIELTLSKLKETWLDSMESQDILNNMESLLNRKVTDKAISQKDIKLCSELSNSDISSCEIRVISESFEKSDCDMLSNTGSVNSCKNTFTKKEIISSNNPLLCEEIIWESEEEVLRCKDRVNQSKALKDLDKSFCENISENIEKDMCKDMIEMELQIRSDMPQ